MVPAFAVVALVLGSCADQGAGDTTSPGTQPAVTTDMAVTGTDSLRFQPDTLTVPAEEEVTLTFSAGAGVAHDFVVEEAADIGTAEAHGAAHGSDESGDGVDDGDLHVVHADPGRTSTAIFQINEPGTYTVYCSVPGHRESGMLATLTVVDVG